MSTSFNIEHIAKLARLKLSPAEKDKLGPQLEKIVGYIDQLNRLDTANVEPTSHVLPIRNVFREDDPQIKLPSGDCLAQAPASDKGHYEVPQIL